jgi:nicotinamide mononucleotide (NMN) deamidase PncC
MSWPVRALYSDEGLLLAAQAQQAATADAACACSGLAGHTAMLAQQEAASCHAGAVHHSLSRWRVLHCSCLSSGKSAAALHPLCTAVLAI